MFNEILNGKASLEPRPASMDPYRQAGALPPIERVCVTCSRTYQAPAGSQPGACPSCNQQLFEINARNDALAFQLAEQDAQRSHNSHRLFAVIGGIVVIVALGFFRFGMRSQMREDAAQAAGYRSYDQYKSDSEQIYATDTYSMDIDRLASEMCFCTDLKCARDVQSKFTNYVRSHAPSDDMSESYSRQESIRLADCQAAIEAGAVPER